MKIFRSVLVVLWALVFLVRQVPAQSLTDRGAIDITVNEEDLWTAEEAWTVIDTPDVVIGEVEGSSPEYLFSRIEAIELLENGGIAVANRGTAEVRFFDAQGSYQGAVGESGEGPGEFRWLGWIGECSPGRLDAYDPILGRVTRIRVSDHSILATRRLRSAILSRHPTKVHCLGNGHLGVTRRLGAPPQEPGRVRWPVVVESFDSDGRGRYLYEMPGDERYFDGGTVGPLHFGKRAVHATYDTLFASGTQDATEITLRDVAGTPARIVRWSDSVSEITAEDVRTLTENTTTRRTSDETEVGTSRRFREYPFPETHPAYGALIFDDLGYLWIEDSPHGTDSNGIWRVFKQSGELLGTVQLPRRFRPMAFGKGKVVGVWRNDLDVEFVWILQIRRP